VYVYLPFQRWQANNSCYESFVLLDTQHSTERRQQLHGLRIHKQRNAGAAPGYINPTASGRLNALTLPGKVWAGRV